MKKLHPIAMLAILFLTTKFDSFAQGWVWGTGSTNTSSAVEIFKMASDRAGNLYEVGYGNGGVTTLGSIVLHDSLGVGAQGIIASVDSSGNYRWALATQAGAAFFYDVACDTLGNVFVSGSTNYGVSLVRISGVTLPGANSFCIKIDTAGNVKWIKAIGPISYVSAGLIKVTKSGDVFISGSFRSPTFVIGGTTLVNTDPSSATNDVFYAKYDSSLTPIWAKSITGKGNDGVSEIALYNDSTLYLTGSFLSPTLHTGIDSLVRLGSLPFFVAKIDTTGTVIWSREIASKDTMGSNINGIAVDDAGSLYITGGYADTVLAFGTTTLPQPPCSYMFLAKYDKNGTPKWLSGLNFSNAAYSIVTDKCGNIWTSGSYSPLGCYISDVMLLTKWDSSGILEDTLHFPIGGDDQSAVVADNIGSLYVGGDYVDHIVVGGHSLPASPGESCFFAKYRYDISGCSHDTLRIPLSAPGGAGGNNAINIFPNPASQIFHVHSQTPLPNGTQMELYDLAGRMVTKWPLQGYDSTIEFSDVTTGMYIYKIFYGRIMLGGGKLCIMGQ